MLAEIITIGDEILIGQIVDTNSAWIATQLNQVGIRVERITSISDSLPVIVASLKEASQRSELILITGGLGPTRDDVTKRALADYFGVGLKRNDSVLAHVEGIFRRMNRPILDINRAQADVLENAAVLHNETGTAPGMWMEKEGVVFVSMPGVPAEMMYLVSHELLPRLEKLPGRQAIVHQTILTAGIGESFLAERIKEVEDRLPEHLHLAYLPSYGQVRLRLSSEGEDRDKLLQEEKIYLNEIAKLVPEFLVAEEDISLERLVLLRLVAQGQTLGTAESCTGGYLAHRFTAIPGASQAYLGSVVAYSNQLKESLLGVSEQTLSRFGAVSEETVKEMALGLQKRLLVDYAVATSGIAGPDGGSEEKPVGTVWIAVAGKKNCVAKRLQLGKIRSQIIERASAMAILELHNLIKMEETVDQ